MIFLGSKYNFVLVFLMMVLIITPPTYCNPQGEGIVLTNLSLV